ncbi:hypothetical protein LCGC14_1282640 [marine sediment metagenome]|uniref:Uncharacterized protein n=1 Tax=marine sediment metagenome TaxID=412755 RepID=A0A0F9NBC1_9ZZZZ
MANRFALYVWHDHAVTVYLGHMMIDTYLANCGGRRAARRVAAQLRAQGHKPRLHVHRLAIRRAC